jgi:hypothetical protein
MAQSLQPRPLSAAVAPLEFAYLAVTNIDGLSA